MECNIIGSTLLLTVIIVSKLSIVPRIFGFTIDSYPRVGHEDDLFDEFLTLGTVTSRGHNSGTSKFMMVVDSRGRMSNMKITLRPSLTTLRRSVDVHKGLSS